MQKCGVQCAPSLAVGIIYPRISAVTGEIWLLTGSVAWSEAYILYCVETAFFLVCIVDKFFLRREEIHIGFFPSCSLLLQL